MDCPRHFSVGDQTWVQFGSKYKPLHAFNCATLLFRNRVQINFARDFRCGVPQQCLHSSYWSTYAIKHRCVAASEDAERPAAKSVVFPDFVRPDSPTRCFARGQIDRRVVRNRLSIWHLLDRQGDREGDGYGDLCLSCTRHPFTLQIAVEVL